MSPFDAALPSTEDLFSVIEAIHDNVAIVDHNGVMRWVSSCFELQLRDQPRPGHRQDHL